MISWRCSRTSACRRANSAAVGPGLPSSAWAPSDAVAHTTTNAAAPIALASLACILPLLSINEHQRRRDDVVGDGGNPPVLAVLQVLALQHHALGQRQPQAGGRAPGLGHVDAVGAA